MSATWHYDKPTNGILEVRIDREDQPVNSLSRAALNDLRELVAHIRDDPTITGVVFQSSKPGNFIAGADLKELKTLLNAEAAREISQLGQQVFSELESLNVPTVALISGACLGGGLEFAMACRYRIADDSPKTLLGLPEVQLGLIPGWGGTVRLPRLVGFIEALPLILSGKKLNPHQAKKRGLVHDVVSTEALHHVGRQFLKKLSDAGGGTAAANAIFRPRRKPWWRRMLENNGLVQQYAARRARAEVMAKTKGDYPAPMKALEVLTQGRNRSTSEKFALEAEGISMMAGDPVTAQCMRLFFLSERAKHVPHWLDARVDSSFVDHAGVIGAGAMGAGIAMLMARKGIHTRMKDISEEFVDRGMKSIGKIVHSDVKRRRMSSLDGANTMGRISPTTTNTGFAHAQVIIEAVVEELSVKQQLFRELAAVCKPDTILATNTSSLRVSEIARDVPNPERVVGIHFFNPPHKMPLVEIVRSEMSSPEAIAAAFALVRRLGKTGVVVGDCAGFLVNRLLSPYLNEAGYLLTEVDDPLEIERAAIEFGMPMGPLELTGLVGIPVASHVVDNMFAAYGERMQPARIWEELLPAAQSNRGFKLVSKSKKGHMSVTPEAAAVVESVRSKDGSKGSSSLTRPEIINRLIYPLINEAARALEEGVVATADELDLAMVLGTGFAPFRGGPLAYAQQQGISTIADAMTASAIDHPRLAPSAALLQAAAFQKFTERGDVCFSNHAPVSQNATVATEP